MTGRSCSFKPRRRLYREAAGWRRRGIYPWPYRTSAASARLVYNTQADEFLALTFQEVSDWTDQYLIGQQLGSDGEPIGEPVAWGEAKLSTRPAIVHDSVTNHYLVARGMWFPTEPTGGEPMRSFLEMQLLRSGLSLVRHPFTLFAVDDQQPAVAHNPDDNEFMVVWRGASPMGSAYTTTVTAHRHAYGHANTDHHPDTPGYAADSYRSSDAPGCLRPAPA